jgi:hypothetical protein
MFLNPLDVLMQNKHHMNGSRDDPTSKESYSNRCCFHSNQTCLIGPKMEVSNEWRLKTHCPDDGASARQMSTATQGIASVFPFIKKQFFAGK